MKILLKNILTKEESIIDLERNFYFFTGADEFFKNDVMNLLMVYKSTDFVSMFPFSTSDTEMNSIDFLKKVSDLLKEEVQIPKEIELSFVDFDETINDTPLNLYKHFFSHKFNGSYKKTTTEFYDSFFKKQDVNPILKRKLEDIYHRLSSCRNVLVEYEPELLCPQDQLEYIQVFLKLAFEWEYTIILKTHSSLFAKIFNNYLISTYLKSIGGDLPESDFFDWTIPIDIEKIGVYVFTQKEFREHTPHKYGVVFKELFQTDEIVQEIQNKLVRKMFKKEDEKESDWD